MKYRLGSATLKTLVNSLRATPRLLQLDLLFRLSKLADLWVCCACVHEFVTFLPISLSKKALSVHQIEHFSRVLSG